MGYCRNCRAQLKGASICTACGTERIRPKKRLKHLSEHKDGAAALRASISENRALLICIAFAVTVNAVLSLVASVRALPEEGILPLLTAIGACTGLLLPMGLLLLLRESRRSGAFSVLGFRLAKASILLSILPLFAIGSLYSALWEFFLLSFQDGFAFLLSCIIFGFLGILLWWYGYAAVLFYRFEKLATRNKRFRVSRIFELGLLAGTGLLFLSCFTRASSTVSAIAGLSSGAASCMFFALLNKVKKHI